MQLYFKNRIDREDKRSRNLFLFLLIWFLINLVQSAFTELAHDEAYYWMYSRQLEWGYFDHPPMIALLIKLGYSIFPNEFGLRLFTTILGTLTLFAIYTLIERKDKSLWLFILITSSIVLVQSHISGFIAIPDNPILFFSALFFVLYKKYLEKDTYIYALLLGVVTALMFYSKYHAILVVGFTLLANLKIMRRWSFWVIPVVSITLFLPHILWQIKNGYPSIIYHLFTRSDAYEIDHTINYLYSELLIAGPFASVLIFYKSFAYKIKNDFDRVLKINLIGIFAFFFLSSFMGHVEAHWTAIAFIPMIILAYKNSLTSDRAMLWYQRLFLPSFILFLFIRLVLIFDFLPVRIGPLQEVHNWDKWAREIDSLADNRDVVFVNSFQRPSKYSFYTGGKPAHTLNDIHYRKNQFDIWPIEDSLQHKPVLLMHSRISHDTLSTAVGEDYRYELINDFKSYFNLIIEVDSSSYTASVSDTLCFKGYLNNTRLTDLNFDKGDVIVASFYTGKKFLKPIKVADLRDVRLEPREVYTFKAKIPCPPEPGKYQMYLSVYTLRNRPALNSKPVGILLK